MSAVFPTPFQSGFRTVRGEDLNAIFAFPNVSTQDTITAFAGGGQTSAVQLTAQISRVTTVATAADSVKLPVAKAGSAVYVINSAATNGMQVFGNGTDTINGIATATGILQPAGATWVYTCTTAGAWITGLVNESSSIVLNGSTSGTTTLKASAIAGSTTQTFPAVTGVVASTTGTNLYVADLKRCSGSVTANGTTTYANVTGLSFTVVAGTYEFVLRLPSTVASGTGGIKYAFNYTTTALTSIEATGRGFTASAVAVQHTTTTTTQTDLFTQAAVVIYTEITGTMVVSTGGTVDVQMAQNTSNGSNSIALVGASAQFTRIA